TISTLRTETGSATAQEVLRDREVARRAQPRARRGCGERIDEGLGPPSIVCLSRRIGQPQEHAPGRRVPRGEQIVEHRLGTLDERGRRRIRRGPPEVARRRGGGED